MSTFKRTRATKNARDLWASPVSPGVEPATGIMPALLKATVPVRLRGSISHIPEARAHGAAPALSLVAFDARLTANTQGTRCYSDWGTKKN